MRKLVLTIEVYLPTEADAPTERERIRRAVESAVRREHISSFQSHVETLNMNLGDYAPA